MSNVSHSSTVMGSTSSCAKVAMRRAQGRLRLSRALGMGARTRLHLRGQGRSRHPRRRASRLRQQGGTLTQGSRRQGCRSDVRTPARPIRERQYRTGRCGEFATRSGFKSVLRTQLEMLGTVYPEFAPSAVAHAAFEQRPSRWYLVEQLDAPWSATALQWPDEARG